MMKRNLKALGLAIAAVFAMSAIAASAAQAEFPAQLTSEFSPVTLDGTQIGVNTVLKRSNRTVECEIAKYSGEGNAGDTTAAVTPVYENCTSNVGPATVTVNGCHYLFHFTASATDAYSATADLKCEAGHKIEVHIYTGAANHASGTSVCTYSFGETGNQGLSTVTLSNEAGSPDFIKAGVNVSGISSTRPAGQSALICGPESDATGTLIGEAKLTGTTEGGGPNGITISTD